MQTYYWDTEIFQKGGQIQFCKSPRLYQFTLRTPNIQIQKSIEVKVSFWLNIAWVFARSKPKATMSPVLQVTGYIGQGRNLQIVWLDVSLG